MKRRLGVYALIMCVLSWLQWSCGVGPIPSDLHTHGEEDTHGQLDDGRSEQALRVSESITTRCSTSVVRGLSEQLLAEINCIRPSTMASISGISGVTLGSAVLPWLQKPAAEALRRAVAARKTSMYITSAIRTLPQQYLLYEWYRRGLCGIPLAASPGNSNHEAGLAIDTSDYSGWRPTLSRYGFRWLGGNDPVHFDYVQGGVDLRGLSVLAFQRLWNRNNPKDRISEDGGYGAQTAARIARSPGEGFPLGASCKTSPPPVAPPNPPNKTESFDAIELYWARESDGRYKLHALAPDRIVKVEYYVDNFLIAIAERKQGDNFPAFYRFSVEKAQRLFEVRGFDTNGKRVGLGVGMLDVTEGPSFSIRQLGTNLYEVSLERPPTEVAAVEVDIDRFPITDTTTNQRRNTRRAVRFAIQQLGTRQVSLSTFNADGSLRGTLQRSFTFR